MNDFLTVKQLSSKDISDIFKKAHVLRSEFNRSKKLQYLDKKLVALLFYEPSTRTFSSFTTAIKRMGGQTIEYQNPTQTSSHVKGETLEDTARIIENFADLIVIRHFEKGAADRVAETVSIPVINAGDGSGEHPTQALQDLYTIYEKHGKTSDLKGLVVGDLLYGRAVHSLLEALSIFPSNTVYTLAPEALQLNQTMKKDYEKKGLKIIEIKTIDEIPSDLQFWYWTRVQKERFEDLSLYESLKHAFVLTKKILENKGNKDMIVMHPLPRVGEIEMEVDSDPRAVYFTKQIQSGLFIRMALLSTLLKTL